MENPKVFEFAKELGMETLALMDKIREWKLPIKNHMAELSPELTDQIRANLETVAGAKKKISVVKKKEASPKRKSSTSKKEAETKPITKKSAVKAAAIATTPKADAKKREAKTVIRRRADEEPHKDSIVEEMAIQTPDVVTDVVEENIQIPVVAREEQTIIHEPDQVKEEVQPIQQPTPIEEQEELIEEKVLEAKEISEAEETHEPDLEKEDLNKKKAVSRKKEVTIGASGVASSATPISATPKRNIIGRMDLSRVKQMGRPQDTTQRPQRTGTQTLRPGFIAPEPSFIPDPEELAFEEQKKRDKFAEKKQPRAPKVEEETQFSSSDFKKREMVFQPKKKKVMKGEGKKTLITVPKASKRLIKIHGTISVAELAQEMGIKAPQLIGKLVGLGAMVTMNSRLDFDTVALVIPEFGFEAQNVLKSVDDLLGDIAFGGLEAEKVSRPPVVTVMGHVDHGKTSLLDAIRKTDVAGGEAGGITQHIGAYSVTLEDGHVITFIDTPGHEAFTAMRARGANVTDIAIIVVAADDGVMPQTAEAINHAKAAGVPIIIAVNKIDRPNANPDRIRQQLTEYEIVPEEWGGTNIFCEVSALKKQGIKELLEQIIVQSEILELRANPERSGTGIVIESRQEKGRGSVATFLVKDGTVRVGQYVVAGAVHGKVRNIFNDRGVRIDEAGPSQPIEILGLENPPRAGDRFDICEKESQAEEIAAKRLDQENAIVDTPNAKMSLDDIFAKMKRGDLKELPIVLKADVAGSLEAIVASINKLGTDEVKVKIIHTGVGGINESDVLLASTSSGLVVGFGVRPDSAAERMAKNEGVDIRIYSIIYELLDDLKKAMSGLLAPETKEVTLGRAEVRDTFGVPKVGVIAGCLVVDGKILRNGLVRLVRDGRMVYEGKISSLKRFKDDAREVASGFECGVGIENYNDIKVGDVIEVYQLQETLREL